MNKLIYKIIANKKVAWVLSDGLVGRRLLPLLTTRILWWWGRMGLILPLLYTLLPTQNKHCRKKKAPKKSE